MSSVDANNNNITTYQINDSPRIIKIKVGSTLTYVPKMYLDRSRIYSEWSKKNNDEIFLIDSSMKEFDNLLNYLSGAMYEITDKFKLLLDELNIDHTEEINHVIDHVMLLSKNPYQFDSVVGERGFFLHKIECIIKDSISAKLLEKKDMISNIHISTVRDNRCYMTITYTEEYLMKLGWYDLQVVFTNDECTVLMFWQDRPCDMLKLIKSRNIPRVGKFDHENRQTFYGVRQGNMLYSHDSSYTVYVVLSDTYYQIPKFTDNKKNKKGCIIS